MLDHIKCHLYKRIAPYFVHHIYITLLGENHGCTGNQGSRGYVIIFKFTRVYTFQLVTASTYSRIHSRPVSLHGHREWPHWEWFAGRPPFWLASATSLELSFDSTMFFHMWKHKAAQHSSHSWTICPQFVVCTIIHIKISKFKKISVSMDTELRVFEGFHKELNQLST